MNNNDFGYSENIPENIREVFMWLCQDVAALYQEWYLFLSFFGNEETTNLLTDLAPTSYSVIYQALQNDIIMRLCRLSDPDKMGNFHNLSFDTLVKKCPELVGLNEKVTKFQDVCARVHTPRNKRIGHRDLLTTTRPQENPLPGISKKKFEIILVSASEILNYVIQQYEDTEISFKLHVSGELEHLFYWLKAVKSIQQDIKILNNGIVF